jgi:hypothetical protein
MLDINIVNFLTVGVISLAVWAAFKAALGYFGVSASWAA